MKRKLQGRLHEGIGHIVCCCCLFIPLTSCISLRLCKTVGLTALLFLYAATLEACLSKSLSKAPYTIDIGAPVQEIYEIKEIKASPPQTL
jgi:hypothetical protein